MADDGGPAFPQNDAIDNRINNEAGMSLRDYFAAAALRGLLAIFTAESISAIREPGALVASAYQLADAMLAERVK